MASVLIIEDSPTEAHALKRVLERHGFEVSIATSGEQGIEMAVGRLPDLILMDIVMPGVNGFQATRELSRLEATAGIPIIITTTKDQETDRIWATRQGARDYLVKPVRERDLLSCVRSALTAEEPG